MKLFKKSFFLTIIELIIWGNPIYCQVKATGADAVQVTSYASTDTVYVYDQYTNAKHGIFTAVSPWGGNASFTWSRFDATSMKFVPLSLTETMVGSSKLDTTLGGGYKVDITTGSGQDTSFTFWFYPHKLTLSLEKNDAGYLPYYRYQCNHIDLKAIVKSDTFKYYNPDTISKIGTTIKPDKIRKYTLANGIRYNWSADQSDAGTLQSKANFRIYDPPTKDTTYTYTCTVTDSFNYKINDHVLFKAIAVKAAFAFTTDAAVETSEGEKNSAPFHVSFGNNSENATKYTWYMGNADTIEVNTKDSVKYIFKESGTYTIRLIVQKGDYGCIDSTKDVITVDPAYIEGSATDKKIYPNVFVTGTEFRFKPVNASVSQYTFTIYSRWGKKIYEENDIYMNNIKGWDGMIGNSIASEGVYYYILVAKPAINSKKASFEENYKGFFYLYHSK
jgi:hypothetical protein